MADKNTTIITNLDASPPTLTNPGQSGAIIRQSYASLTTDTVHADADVLRFFRVHSSWIFVACRLSNADLSDAAAPDLELGLYLAESGAALDDDCFIAAQAGEAATDSGLVVTPAGAATAQTVETMFALGGGTAANDDQWYDVAVTFDTAATAIAGLVLVQMWYIDPGA
jgi:hypothetical protein